MRIGELAGRTGVNIETIRYYERAGLLAAPRREANNYRDYADEHRRRLVFIRRARNLGFTVEQIRTLLSMADGGGQSCATVQALGETHLRDVRARIADLRHMETVLEDLVSSCESDSTPDCSMLDSLFEG